MSDAPLTTSDEAALAPATPADTQHVYSRWQVLLVCLLLSLVTGLLFARSVTFEFVKLDDEGYVFNRFVRQGFTPETLEWVTTAVVVGNWHPVTMVTHMLDVELYGLEPWGHHLTNVLLHALSTGLLCYVLWRMSGALWPSVVAAALFGLHPMRVESVSWIAERKDVLSVFFFVLALWAYVNYVQRGRWLDYALVLVAATLGLMSKPMLVTLPFVLLLLDYWPLNRLATLGRLEPGSSPGGTVARGRSRAARAKQAAQQKTFLQLVLEKVPLFALVAIFCAITFWSQRSQGAVRSSLPPTIRALNAMLSYRDYFLQTVWPSGLCMFYPHPGLEISKVSSLVAGLALVLFTGFFFQQRFKQPYLLVGWLWFLGTLVPVIGVIPLSYYARADRFMYLPSIGLSIMAGWFVYEFARSRRLLPLATVAMLAIVTAYGVVTWQQQAYWENTIALAQRAIDVTKANFMGHSLLGAEYLGSGHPREAAVQLQETLEIQPRHRLAAFEMGMALRELNEPQASLEAFEMAQQIGPPAVDVAAWHADALVQLGRRDEAQRELTEVLKFDPGNSFGNSLVAQMLAAEGNTPAALNWLREVHRQFPGKAQIATSLAWLLATHPDVAQRNAIEALQVIAATKSLQLQPDFGLLQAEAAVRAERGEFDEALTLAEQAEGILAPLAGDSPKRLKQLEELKEQMRGYRIGRPWREDPRDKFPPVGGPAKSTKSGARVAPPHATPSRANPARTMDAVS